MMKAVLTLLIILGASTWGMAQEERPEGMIPYSTAYEFTDGIYLNFEMVKEANPLPPARIVTDLDMFDREFYEKITLLRKL